MIEIIIIALTILVVIFCMAMGSDYSIIKALLSFIVSINYIIYWGYRKDDTVSLILSIIFLICTILFGIQTVSKKDKQV